MNRVDLFIISLYIVCFFFYVEYFIEIIFCLKTDKVFNYFDYISDIIFFFFNIEFKYMYEDIDGLDLECIDNLMMIVCE